MPRMRGILTRTSLLTCAALAAAVASCPSNAADIKSARVWAGPDYTRVVFDLSGPMDYQLTQQAGQVTLSITDSNLARGFDAPAAHGLFKGLSNDRRGSDLQLVAKVDTRSRPKSFLLKPAGSNGYRLVLDLYPDGAAKPPVSEHVDSKAVAAAARAEDEAAIAQATASTVSRAPAPTAPSATGSRRNSRNAYGSRQAAAMLSGERKVVVAIDAGHGGKDPGSHGPGGTLEKNVTLAVAKALAAQINRQPGMQAILTRDSDIYIPLERRFQIARENNADMFVSVHADAYSSEDARGSSVWVLSSRGKSNEAARWLADRENRADLIGGTTLDDKNDNLASVLLDMQQGYAMQASESIAGNVLKALGQLGPTHRGYVERANFVVLRSPDVPSILVETAFISNPQEERKLRDSSHQEQLAEAVMGGVKNYFESTPPPGSWFAAQAARRKGGLYAAAVPDDGGASSAKQGKALADDTSDKSAAADGDAQDTHRVTRGESLRSIARQYGVSVNALKSANSLSSDASVHAGMVLAIPSS